MLCHFSFSFSALFPCAIASGAGKCNALLSFSNIERSARKKNTSLDASSEGASDGPTKETSKVAKLHGLWQCPLQCVFRVLSFRGFSLDASQTRQYFGAYLFSTPSRTPRGKSVSLRQSVAHASTKPCFNQFSSLPFIVWLLM